MPGSGLRSATGPGAAPELQPPAGAVPAGGRRPEEGLSEDEAAAAARRGETNAFQIPPSRTFLAIIRSNLLTAFNLLLFALGAALLALGEVVDAISSAGLALLIAVIGTLQEVRAKWHLDRASFLHVPAARVIRGGRERALAPHEVVRGDHIRLGAGDQVIADGPVLAGIGELDESLLTGESETVPKHPGDPVLSGSYCATGSLVYRADAVAEAAYANRLTERARAYRPTRTALEKRVAAIVRLFILFAFLTGALVLAAEVVWGVPTSVRLIRLSATMTGMVPYGLFFAVAIAYAVSAAALLRRGALAQQSNAIEGLSEVDVVCADKTGTLTARLLRLSDLKVTGPAARPEVEAALGAFVRSGGEASPTLAAIADAVPGEYVEPVSTVPFTPVRKWSAMSFGRGPVGTYALGAFEFLRGCLDPEADLEGVSKEVSALASSGKRVLVFAGRPDPVSPAPGDAAAGPTGLVPLAVIALAEQLRPGAAESVSRFAGLGVRVVLLSGDDARTVAAVAAEAGIPARRVFSGPELERMDEAAFSIAAAEGDVFGRTTPAQKERIVATLRGLGHRVAMVGDGVNDVPALKEADVGIAVKSGSAAARNIASITLLDDDLSPLIRALGTGQRVVDGLTKSAMLYTARVAGSLLVIIGVLMLGLRFPFEPEQLSLTLFSVGIPTLLLAWWITPSQAPQRPMASFVVPVAIATFVLGTALFALEYLRLMGAGTAPPVSDTLLQSARRGLGEGMARSSIDALVTAQSTLSLFVNLSTIALLVFLQPPAGWLAGWAGLVARPRRAAVLAAGLSALLLAAMMYRPSADIFRVTPLTPPSLALVTGMLIIWGIALQLNWRYGWLDSYLGLGTSTPASRKSVGRDAATGSHGAAAEHAEGRRGPPAASGAEVDSGTARFGS